MSEDHDTIAAAVATARAGFDAGRTRPLEWRKAQLRRLREMLVREERAILDALRADLGKADFEGWLGEVALVLSEVDHTLSHLESWAAPEKVRAPLALQPARARILRQPLGTVLIISPWNYPFQLAVAPMIGAIAAGNAIVVKPSEVAAHTSALLARLLPNYLDRECIQVLEGGVPETTRILEQRFDHIFYTGNGHVGRIILEAAAVHLTPVTLELGGKSPCIVDGSANLKVAARRIVWGKFFNAGQTCVAPDYVLCKKDVESQLIERLRETVREFFGGDPAQTSDYARIINERHFERLLPLLEDGETVVGGAVDAETRYIAPTILRGISAHDAIMKEEIFGPILPILSVDSIDEAIAFVNERPRPLALYVFTTEGHISKRVLERTTSGGACVNDCITHLGVPDLPFGGVGASGMGGYHGRASFETFSHRRGVLHKPNILDAPLRYPPYSDAKLKWIRRLV